MAIGVNGREGDVGVAILEQLLGDIEAGVADAEHFDGQAPLRSEARWSDFRLRIHAQRIASLCGNV